ncbi:MAG: CAP domain-containing protein, partial [Acidimicrobiales bacterium]
MEGRYMGTWRQRLAVTLTAVVVAVTATLGTGSAGADPAREASFLAKLNELRAGKGLRQLVVRNDLVAVARAWTDQMVRNGDISHNPSLASQAPLGWLRLGENVGMGGSVDQIHAAFVASPAHYRQMVDGAFDSVGIAVAQAPNATLFVTVDFMTSSVVPAAIAPVVPPATVGTGPGYRLAASDGVVFNFGAASHGSAASLNLTRPIVGMANSPSDNGYWLVASDGGIFAFGDAR